MHLKSVQDAKHAMRINVIKSNVSIEVVAQAQAILAQATVDQDVVLLRDVFFNPHRSKRLQAGPDRQSKAPGDARIFIRRLYVVQARSLPTRRRLQSDLRKSRDDLRAY